MRVPFILDSDASDSRLGAVLSQVQGGRERVIAYAARSLSKAERNYNTLRNELLALRWATENFETFLYGQHFLARTDHSALPWLENLKNPRSQVARWLERLIVTLILSWNIVRVSCMVMQMACPVFPLTRMHQLGTGEMPP